MAKKGARHSEAPRAPGSASPRYFSIRDVADWLRVSTRTVRRWNKAGVLPVHRIGNVIRISEADLEAFLTRNRDAE